MRLGLGAVAVLTALVVPGRATGPASADPTDIAGFIKRAAASDIVILGERHDNPGHHRNQAEIVAALQPAALVFEMIDQEYEDAVNELREAGAPRVQIEAALDWQANGWPDFAQYAQVLEAAPEARVFGAGQPLADVRRAMVEGATGAFGPDAQVYGLDLALEPDEQAAREALQATAHCDMLPAEMLSGMVEAQRFRDAGLADAALWARTMTGGGQVVVITGNGHADKLRGVPAVLAVADPSVDVLSLGQIEHPSEADPAAFDAMLMAPAPARDDPCDALRPRVD